MFDLCDVFLNQPLNVNLILPPLYNKGKSALRHSSMALNNPNPLGPWKVSVMSLHERLPKQITLFCFYYD